jgi:flagellar protein FlgJ
MNTISDPKTSYDFAGIGALKAQAARDGGDDDAIKKTADQFEAMFLQMMMKSMRSTIQKGGLLDSAGTETFEQMLDQQFAMAMAGRRSTGLSQMVEEFIRRSQGLSAEEPAPANFSLDPPSVNAMPLVNESVKFKISEDGAQNFLLNRNRLNLRGGN